MSIISPKHSFIRFDESMSDVVLPIYDKLNVAFQFTFSSDSNIPVGTEIKIAVANLQNDIIYTTGIFFAKNICSWGKITGVEFPMTVGSGQAVPAGSYENITEFLSALKVIGLNAYADEFLQCCADWYEGFSFIYNENHQGVLSFYRGLQQVTLNKVFSFSDFNAVPLGICFKLAITDIDGIVYGYSNTFRRVKNSIYLTHVRYSCNEDAYGFKYPDAGMFNALALPMYLRFPTYPEKRTVYIKSNKDYKVLSAIIEKQYELITESFTDKIHEKIAVMLAHDNVHFYNPMFESDIYKKDEYSVDWEENKETGFDEGMGKCKILIPFEGRNSNCEKRPGCCNPVQLPFFKFPDAALGQTYSYNITLAGKAPFGLFDLVKPTWMNVYTNFNSITFTGFPNEAESNIHVSGTFSNCSGAFEVSFSDTFNIAGMPVPLLTETGNSATVGGIRTQIFEIGPVVQPGNKYELTVYSHTISVIAAPGDTPSYIANKLVLALNNTTPTQWNDAASAPAVGTVGFPPHASAAGATITINLNYNNQFAGSATIF